MSEYIQYLAQTVTWLISGIIILISIAVIFSKKDSKGGKVVIQSLSDKSIEDNKLFSDSINAKTKKQIKVKKNNNVFVIDFFGDSSASQLKSLREEVSLIIDNYSDGDRVIIRLESCGGYVHSYGLASSQLSRLSGSNIAFDVCVDKVAASGGYMMACTANKIVAAPFSVIGSIGVVAQLPNINKLLKKNDIDIELHTAGKNKRTLTFLGENTEEGRLAFKEDINKTHGLFKDFIKSNRSCVDIEKVATGDVWYGIEAINNKLIDKVMTSDDYIRGFLGSYNVWSVKYEFKKTVASRFKKGAESSVNNIIRENINNFHNNILMK